MRIYHHIFIYAYVCSLYVMICSGFESAVQQLIGKGILQRSDASGLFRKTRVVQVSDQELVAELRKKFVSIIVEGRLPNLKEQICLLIGLIGDHKLLLRRKYLTNIISGQGLKDFDSRIDEISCGKLLVVEGFSGEGDRLENSDDDGDF